jgi:hypothetical protein
MKSLWVLVGSLILLASCSDPKVANENNFRRAISHWIAKDPPCLQLLNEGMHLPNRPGGAYPRYLESPTEPNLRQVERENRLKAVAPYDALVDVGLLKATHTRLAQSGWFGEDKNVAVIAYDLTDKGKQTVAKDAKNAFGQPNTLCYGKPKVDEIVHFTEPSDAMGMKLSQVSYRYHVADLPDWVNDAKVKAAFPDIAEHLADHLDGKATLVLTNEGWKHEREM